MLLPVLNIAFPTDEWEIAKTESLESQEGESGYAVAIKHVPSGQTFEAIDEGWGGEIDYYFTPEQDELKEAWNQFAATCVPRIREHDKLRGYDLEEEYGSEDASDSVIGLLFEEIIEQSIFATKKSTIVREEGASHGVFKTFKAKPDALRNVGKIKGDYWNKTTRSWVAI